MFADALTFPCFALSAAAPPTNAQNTSEDFWKPYAGKTLFKPLGTPQRILVLQAGVPAPAVSGEPWGNWTAWRKDAGSL